MENPFYWLIMILPKNQNFLSIEEQYHRFCSIRYQSGWLTHSILEIIVGNFLITRIPLPQWYPTIKTIGWIPWNHFIEVHWYLLFIKQIDFDSWIIYIISASIVTKDSLFMWKRPVSRIMILRMDNSSISCSFATKYFLCAAVKKNMPFRREILSHQSSHKYLTYSYLMIFHKVVTKACTNLSIFQFDPIHSFVELFILSQTFLEHL